MDSISRVVFSIEWLEDAQNIGIDIAVENSSSEVLDYIKVIERSSSTQVETNIQRDLKGNPISIVEVDSEPLSLTLISCAVKVLEAAKTVGVDAEATRDTSEELLAEVEAYSQHVERPSGSNPTFDVEQVRNLLLGSTHWNQWLDSSGTYEINLAGAYLEGVNLSGARLLGANMICAKLSGANLDSAVLIGAELAYSDLGFTKARKADLEVANLVGANLQSADISGALLHMANMQAANLNWAVCEDTNLMNADLTGADLSRANLSNANLEGAALNYASLTRATLNNADLRNARGVSFDDNDIRGTRFTALTSGFPVRWVKVHNERIGLRLFDQRTHDQIDDEWSGLRRHYTGANLVLVWMVLLIFGVPRIITIMGLVLLQEYEQVTAATIQALPVATNSPKPDVWIAVATELAHGEKHDIWSVVLGIHNGGMLSYVWATAVLILFLYNSVRFWLTMRVTPLRDSESRSGVTPSFSDYHRLFLVHRITRIIAVLALVIGIVNLLQFLLWFLLGDITL